MLALFPLATLARLLHSDATLDAAIAIIAAIIAIIAIAAIAGGVAARSAVASEGKRTQQGSLAMIVVH